MDSKSNKNKLKDTNRFANDLFNNPMTNSALKAMSSEQREEYRKIGEKLYNGINFEDGKILDSMPAPFNEAIKYIELGLNSGLLPNELSKDEQNLLIEKYGDNWEDKWTK